MITTLLDWLVIATLITVIGIVIPSVVIAKQEIAIEGPFGWSALTFTRRFKTDHWFSKIYRFISGKDKWATEYHLTSNIIWVLIYFLSFLYIPIFSKLTDHSDWRAFIGIVFLAIACCQQLMWVEDFIWFLIHPYYGPDRHNPEYVPWFMNWKAGIPTGYFASMISGIALVAIGAFITQNLNILVVWVESFLILLVIVFLIIKPLSKKIKREPLKKFWWKSIKYVVIERCPYYIEGEEPYLNARSFAIDNATAYDLWDGGQMTKLEHALRPPYSQK